MWGRGEPVGGWAGVNNKTRADEKAPPRGADKRGSYAAEAEFKPQWGRLGEAGLRWNRWAGMLVGGLGQLNHGGGVCRGCACRPRANQIERRRDMRVTIRITGDVIAWLADEVGINEDEADHLAQMLVTQLIQSGGLSQIDADGIPESAEERLALATEIKQDLVGTYNLICALAATYEHGQRGPLASALNCSTQDANTWARVFKHGHVIEAEDKLVPGWWRGALDSGMLDEGRANGWSATQMRREAGLIKERVKPRYDGGATVLVNSDSLVTLQLDSPDAGSKGNEYRASVRLTERER